MDTQAREELAAYLADQAEPPSCIDLGCHCTCTPHGSGQCPDCTCEGAAE